MRYADLGLEHAKAILGSIGHDESGCWNWEGMLGPEGYGEYSPNGKGETLAAHKAMYVISRGTVPSDSSLVQTCMTKVCCNPAHMKVVEDRVPTISQEQIKQIATWMGSDCDVSPNVATDSRGFSFDWDASTTAHRMAKLGLK